MTTPSPLEQLMGSSNAAPSNSSGGPSPLEQLLQGPDTQSKPVPIGNQPASLSGVLQTLKPGNGGITAAIKGATTDVLQGAGEGLLQTEHGIGTLINKGANAISPGLGDKIIPPVGSAALQSIATPDAGTAQQVGKTAEDIAEFISGDEALNGLSVADRAMKAANLADKYEKASAFTKAAIDAVLNGTRQGAVTGAETLRKTGDPTEAAEAGVTGAVAGTALNAVGKGIGAIRDIYRPLATAEDVQPVLQNAIRDVAAKAADASEVEAPTSTSIRDVVSDLADSVKEKSQPVFQKIDELSNGEFSDAQAAADKYRGSIDKAGKDAYSDAIDKQNQIFDSVKDKMDPDALTQAKADWKQYNALSEVADAIQKTTSGTRPEIAALSKAAQPIETINPKHLAGKLNSLYNDGTLQTALGDQAHALLDHTGAAQQRLVSISDALTAQKSKQRAVAYVGKRAAIGTLTTGLGVPAAAEGLKLIGVLGGKK